MRGLFSKKDMILCVVILLIALLLWLWTRQDIQSAKEARLYLNGELIQTISLSEDRHFSPNAVPQVELEIKEGRIRFASSDCPDQICIQTGFISAPGAYAVCLPHRLMLQIPPNNDAPDAVTGALPQKGSLS